MNEKLTLLSKVPLFAGLGAKELGEVGRLADEVDVRVGKVLAKEGASAEEFFIILEGTINISRDGRHLRDLGPGDFFGELALLGRIPRTATATASTPARLLVVAHREFASLLGNHPTIQGKILRAVASWIASLTPERSH